MSLCLTLPFPCPLLGVNGDNLLDSESESVSHSVVSDSLWSPWTVAHQASLSMEFSWQQYWSGFCFHSLLQGIFLTQGLNLGLLHCRQILHHLSHQGHLKVKVKVTQWCLTLCDPMEYTVHGILQARILEWVAFPFSRGSFQPRDRTQVSHIACGFFTS